MFGSKVETDENKINELLSRYVDTVFPSKEKAVEILKSGKRMSFYLGIDPTGPDIHLGHSTNFFILKKLVELGHNAILLIGDFTAQIGDPTGKENARKVLTPEEVKQNMRTYLEQAIKILPKGKFKVRYNSEWHRNMTFQRVIELSRHFTVQRMMERDMFQERLKKDEPIFLQEFLYPLVQGYDSVAMKIDGEIGGTDQTFNMLAGRKLVKQILNKEKIIITTKLLEDPVTKKKIMNKSEGRYISMNDSAQDMYGKVMAIPDSSIISLYEYVTEVPIQRVKEAEKRIQSEPKIVKEEVALAIVTMYHGEKSAIKAQEEWDKVFSKGEIPSEMEEVKGKGILMQTTVVAGIIPSNSEFKRLIDQGAIKINNEIVKDWQVKDRPGDIVQIGPRRFVKIK